MIPRCRSQRAAPALLLGLVCSSLFAAATADEPVPPPAAVVPLAPAQPGPPTLAVLGVACTAKDNDWREGMAGFGVQNWIAQAFYDSASYRLVEESAEVRSALEPGLEGSFAAAAGNDAGHLAALAKRLGVDNVAIGRVTNLFTRTEGVTFGPFHQQSRDTYIKLELCLYSAATGKVRTVTGQGKVERSSSAMGADFGGRKLPFDAATVGPATGLAVDRAVAQLVPGYRPRTGGKTPVALTSPRLLAVLPVGLTAEVATAYPELRKKRVNLGLHSRIVQTLGKTPGCNLMEVNPEVLQALELQWWMTDKGAPPPENLPADQLHFAHRPDWIVYGTVFGFAVSRKEKLSGLSGKVNAEVSVSVQLRAVAPGTSPARILLASGTGKAAGDWESWKGEDAEMAQSWVGQAAAKAIEAAWPLLLRDLAASAPPAGGRTQD